jgi:hypothetical protein
MSSVRPILSAAVVPTALTVAALSLALLARLFLIEPPEFGWACQGTVPPAWCPLRAAAIVAVRAGLPGFVALAAGLLALWRGSRTAALTALAAGAAGLALYLPEPAAAGALLGAVALLRRST